MFSIIIPTLNEESVIADTILRLKNKLTLEHEIIISDGQSKDNTVEIARKYADKVVSYTGEKRQTIAQGRNDGAKAAVGEFLVFMDADCTIEDPDHLFNHAITEFGSNPKLIALTSWLKVSPDKATLADKIIFGAQNIFCITMNDIFGMGFSSGGEFQMMRRETFVKLGGYNEKLVASEDIEF
jgi:glycosyltransferase involved in cell wall biosynthesis